MSYYAERIRRVVPDVNVRHVEAFMRAEYGTLDHLAPSEFARAARAAAVAAATDAGLGERLAKSYGL